MLKLAKFPTIIIICISFLLEGCTHILYVQGVKVNKNGKESMHCVLHVNRDVITPELAQKAAEFCQAIEGSNTNTK